MKVDKTNEFLEISDEVGDVDDRVVTIGKMGSAVADIVGDIGLRKGKNAVKR